jgi:hypothetical protein
MGLDIQTQVDSDHQPILHANEIVETFHDDLLGFREAIYHLGGGYAPLFWGGAGRIQRFLQIHDRVQKLRSHRLKSIEIDLAIWQILMHFISDLLTLALFVAAVIVSYSENFQIFHAKDYFWEFIELISSET